VVAHLQASPAPLPVATVVEPAPLGTGGAVRFASGRLASDPVLVMNGDTWLDCDYGAFLDAHRKAGRPVSLLCVEVDDVERYGSVALAGDGSVARFVEKDPSRCGRGLINGGVYLFSAIALDALARIDGPSLERDFLAALPPGAIHAHVAADAVFVDIGTPESLAAAGAIIAKERR
jgi:NDP-sugar pyrophosphorylase family protein